MSDLLIRIVDLHKRYVRGTDEVHALRGVSLTLEAGQIVALRGPSGSGKTTVLNLLAGWEEPDDGRVIWGDGGAAGADREWRDMALLPQRLGLFEEMTVSENVGLPLRLSGADDDGRVYDMLVRLGLDSMAGRLPAETSLGEQQRAALARALVVEPSVILADEPTSHQDERSAGLVLDALGAAVAAGAGCLIATHNDDVSGAADRVLEIRDGSLTSTT